MSVDNPKPTQAHAARSENPLRRLYQIEIIAASDATAKMKML